MEDARLLWNLRNDPESRKASLNESFIPFEDHVRWLSKALASPSYAIYVVCDADGADVGYVRFQREDKTKAQISIALNPSQRGRGRGAASLALGLARIFRRWDIQKIIALIKPENEASRNAFLKAGFAPADGPGKTDGAILVLEKKRRAAPTAKGTSRNKSSRRTGR